VCSARQTLTGPSIELILSDDSDPSCGTGVSWLAGNPDGLHGRLLLKGPPSCGRESAVARRKSAPPADSQDAGSRTEVPVTHGGRRTASGADSRHRTAWRTAQSVFPAKLWRSCHVSLVPEYAPRTNCAIPFLTNGLPQCRNAYRRRFPDGYAPVGGPRFHALTAGTRAFPIRLEFPGRRTSATRRARCLGGGGRTSGGCKRGTAHLARIPGPGTRNMRTATPAVRRLTP
jgi:hypothetical protein